MTSLNRRIFFGVAGSGVAAAAIATSSYLARAATTGTGQPTLETLRQETETSLRSVYGAKNDLDLKGFVSKFSDDVVYQDATLGLSVPGLKNVTPVFDTLFKAVGAQSAAAGSRMPARLSPPMRPMPTTRPRVEPRAPELVAIERKIYHWAKVAAEVARIAPLAEMDTDIVRAVVRNEERRQA